jgi:hypothetical protein
LEAFPKIKTACVRAGIERCSRSTPRMTKVFTMPIEMYLAGMALAFVAKVAIYTGAACFVVRYFWNQSKAKSRASGKNRGSVRGTIRSTKFLAVLNNGKVQAHKAKTTTHRSAGSGGRERS